MRPAIFGKPAKIMLDAEAISRLVFRQFRDSWGPNDEWTLSMQVNHAMILADLAEFGQAEELLRKRIELYEAARARHPERWSGNIRNWVLAPIVCLNPEREAVLQQTSKAA